MSAAETQLTFERRAWCVPSEERAFEGWLEGCPTEPQRQAVLARNRERRANWKPDAQATAQLVQLQSFVGHRVRIQFFDPGTMWLLAEDEWPHPIEACCDGVVTLLDGGHLQAFLLLRDVMEVRMGGCSGLSYLTERSLVSGHLAAVADLYEIASIAYIERFNRTYHQEVLSAYLFDSLDEVREITTEWLEQYNEIRPHDVLGSLPPARYRERLLAAETPV